MTPDAKIAWDLKRASDLFCRQVESALRPVIPVGFSLDMVITIRGGKIRVMPTTMFHGEGWKDQSFHKPGGPEVQ